LSVYVCASVRPSSSLSLSLQPTIETKAQKLLQLTHFWRIMNTKPEQSRQQTPQQKMEIMQLPNLFSFPRPRTTQATKTPAMKRDPRFANDIQKMSASNVRF
jgi:hypothetical protein